MNGPSLIGTLTLLFGFLIVFLVLREFWRWDWKINIRNDLLKSIDQKLARLLACDLPVVDPAIATDDKPSAPAVEKSQSSKHVTVESIKPWMCKHCGVVNLAENSVCGSCGKSPG